MQVLVTGGCGFLGSYLCEHYVEAGHDVTCLDNMDGGDLNNVRSLLDQRQFRLIRGDIRDRKDVEKAMHDCELVIHTAAQIHVDRALIAPTETVETNVLGTLNVLEEARLNRVQRVIYISSSEVYGPNQNPREPMDETHPLDPPHIYGASKVAAERLCYAYAKQLNEPIVILRPFNMYGPRQRESGYGGVISVFISKVLQKEPPVIYGSGLQTRDYTHVADTVNAVLKAAGSTIYGQPMNIGTGVETSVKMIASLILQIMQSPLEAVHIAPRPGEVESLLCDATLAREKLGWRHSIEFRDGLALLIAWRKSGRAEAWTKTR